MQEHVLRTGEHTHAKSIKYNHQEAMRGVNSFWVLFVPSICNYRVFYLLSDGEEYDVLKGSN